MQERCYRKEEFEDYIRKIMETYRAVGLAVTIVSPEKTKYRHFFGWRDVEKQLPIDENTLFGLASITKSFTCLAIMQLHEKRKININDPISRYIPEYRGLGQNTARVYHLMSHSAGFFPQKRLCAVDVARKWGLWTGVTWPTASHWRRRVSAGWRAIWTVRSGISPVPESF